MTSDVKVGYEYLPEPIVEFLKKKILRGPRRVKPHVYHVTQLITCLRKAYYSRTHPGSFNPDTKGLWNMHRGNTFDREWCKLFDIYQRNYKVHRLGVTITGTLDFVYDPGDGDGDILYDLKMPTSTFWKKKDGAGRNYRRQVATYLAMAHANGDLLHIHRARVLMVAEDVIITEVKEWSGMLDKWLWPRAFKLDSALEKEDPGDLTGAEEGWECNFCPSDKKFREGCPLVIRGIIIG